MHDSPDSHRIAQKKITMINSMCYKDPQEIVELEHYGPVTAIACHKNMLFCGCGPILKTFDISTDLPTLIFQKQVLARNKIHSLAISKDGQQLFAGGGRSFSIIDVSRIVKGEHFDIKERAVNEWIVSSQFLDAHVLLILTAHNTVYEIDTNSFTFNVAVNCGEKSILYSGTIQITENGRVLIGAGTVMEGVVLWDYQTKQILHNFTEHEGSIFGIKIDPLGKYAVTCSDDRSIKLYDIELGQLLSTGWGHGSRIWGLEFFTANEELHIFSHGEDTTARIWKYQPENPLLQQIHIWENCHSGKHIWSGCVSIETSTCITGGADGRVRILDIKPCLSDSTVTFNLEQIQQQAQTQFVKNEIIKQFTELNGCLVAISSHGTVLVMSYWLKTWTKLELSPDEKEKFNNFAIMRGFEDFGVVAIASRNGDILCLQFSDSNELIDKYWVSDEHLQNNKVTNLLSYATKDYFYLLTDCPNPRIPFVLREFRSTSGRFRLHQTLLLAQPQQTSFTTTNMIVDQTNNWLILASRYVTIAIFELGGNSYENRISMSSIFKKISPGDTITSISATSENANSLSLFVTVRDGTYMDLVLSKDHTFKYEIQQRNKLSRGFIEGGFYQDLELIVYGFRSSSFFVWNETKQIELMSVACGGAHRQWRLYPSAKNFKFIYMNKSSIYFVHASRRFAKDGVLVVGTHGREIRDISISTEINDDKSCDIITASEDTTLRYGRLHPDGSIKNWWTLNKHVSGLQKVKFIDRDLLGSCAANEEFIIWKLSNSDVPKITDYAVLPTESKSPDLRIMDFDTIKVENFWIVATVFSDSQIKVWKLQDGTPEFSLLFEGTYTTCCLLHVKLLQVNDKLMMNIAATDGHLAIWSLNIVKQEGYGPLGQPLVKQQIHQNSIKGLAFEKSDESKYLLYTGGDDNSLIVSELNFERNGNVLVKTLDFKESAASSTITSISHIGPSTILTVSVDQIVRVWSVKNGSLVCIGERYTTIADTGCSDVAHIDNQALLLVGGSGISSYSLRDTNEE